MSPTFTLSLSSRIPHPSFIHPSRSSSVELCLNTWLCTCVFCVVSSLTAATPTDPRQKSSPGVSVLDSTLEFTTTDAAASRGTSDHSRLLPGENPSPRHELADLSPTAAAASASAAASARGSTSSAMIDDGGGVGVQPSSMLLRLPLVGGGKRDSQNSTATPPPLTPTRMHSDSDSSQPTLHLLSVEGTKWSRTRSLGSDRVEQLVHNNAQLYTRAYTHTHTCPHTAQNVADATQQYEHTNPTHAHKRLSKTPIPSGRRQLVGKAASQVSAAIYRAKTTARLMCASWRWREGPGHHHPAKQTAVLQLSSLLPSFSPSFFPPVLITVSPRPPLFLQPPRDQSQPRD